MFFVAARIDTTAVLEHGDRNPDLTGAILLSFRANLCAKYGIVDSNLSILTLAASDASAQRVLLGDDFELVWTAGQISSITFTAENAKRILKVSSSKATILADNLDTTVITVEVWKPDNSGIATGVTGTYDIPVQTPDSIFRARVSIVNGVASRTLKTAKPGLWKIPAASRRLATVRIGSVAIVDSVLSFDTL